MQRDAACTALLRAVESGQVPARRVDSAAANLAAALSDLDALASHQTSHGRPTTAPHEATQTG